MGTWDLFCAICGGPLVNNIKRSKANHDDPNQEAVIVHQVDDDGILLSIDEEPLVDGSLVHDGEMEWLDDVIAIGRKPGNFEMYTSDERNQAFIASLQSLELDGDATSKWFVTAIGRLGLSAQVHCPPNDNASPIIMPGNNQGNLSIICHDVCWGILDKVRCHSRFVIDGYRESGTIGEEKSKRGINKAHVIQYLQSQWPVYGCCSEVDFMDARIYAQQVQSWELVKNMEYVLCDPTDYEDSCLEEYLASNIPVIRQNEQDDGLPTYMFVQKDHPASGEQQRESPRHSPESPSKALLERLPFDIILCILKYLPKQAVANLRLSSKTISLLKIVGLQSFWKSRFHVDMAILLDQNNLPEGVDIDWRTLWWQLNKPLLTGRTINREIGDNTDERRAGIVFPMEGIDKVLSWRNRRRIFAVCEEILKKIRYEMENDPEWEHAQDEDGDEK